MSLSVPKYGNSEEMPKQPTAVSVDNKATTDAKRGSKGTSVPKKGSSVPSQLSGTNNTQTAENSGLALVREANPAPIVSAAPVEAPPTQAEIAYLKRHEHLIATGKFKTAMDYQRRIDIICNNEYPVARYCRLVLPLLEEKLQEFPAEEVLAAKNPQLREEERQHRVAAKVVLDVLRAELDVSDEMLDERDKADDVFADVYGWGKGLFGGDTSAAVDDAITGKRCRINKTFAPMYECSHVDFKTKFKEKTGYTYNDNIVKNFMSVRSHYINYLSWTEAAKELKEEYLDLPKNQDSLEALEEKFGGVQKILQKHKNYNSLSVEQKCELLNKEVKTAIDFFNEQRRIVLVNSGCMDVNAKGEDALKSGFEELRASYKNEHGKVLDMAGVDDIANRVEEYCQAQEKGGRYVKMGAKIAAAIGVTILTGGYGAIAVGAAVAGTSMAIDVASLATNDIDGDINLESMGDIALDAVVDGATTAAGFKVGSVLAGTKFGWAGKYANTTRYTSGVAGDVGLGMLNEVYHNPNHTITLTGTLMGTGFAMAGNFGLLRTVKNAAETTGVPTGRAKGADLDTRILNGRIHSSGRDMDGMWGGFAANRQGKQISKDLEKLGLDEVYSFDIGQLHAGGARFAVVRNADGTFNISNITRGEVPGVSISAVAKTKTYKLKNGEIVLGPGVYNIDMPGMNRPLRLNIEQDASTVRYANGMSYERMINNRIAALPPNHPYKFDMGNNIEFTVIKDTNGNICLSHNVSGKAATIEEFVPAYDLQSGVSSLKPGEYNISVLDVGTMKIRIPGKSAALEGGAKVANGKTSQRSNYEKIVSGQFAGVPENSPYYFPIGKATIGVLKDGDGNVQIACARERGAIVRDVTDGKTDTYFPLDEQGTAIVIGRKYEIEVPGEKPFLFTPTHVPKASAPKSTATGAPAGVHAETAASGGAKSVELDKFSANLAKRLDKTKPDGTCVFDFDGQSICVLKDFDGRLTICQVGEPNIIIRSISRENARPQNLRKTPVELSGDSYYSITMPSGKSFVLKTPKIEGDAIGVAEWEKSVFRAKPQEPKNAENPTAEKPTGENPTGETGKTTAENPAAENPTGTTADAPKPPVAPTAEDFGRATANMSDDMRRGSDMISEFLDKNLKNNSAQSFDVAPGVKLEFEKVNGEIRIHCASEVDVYARNINKPNAEITNLRTTEPLSTRAGCTYEVLLPNGQMLKIKIPVDNPNPSAGAKAASESADGAAKGKAPEAEPQNGTNPQAKTADPQAEWDNVTIDFTKPAVIESRARLSDAVAKRSEFDADMVALDARIKNGDIPTIAELRALRKKFGMYCTNMSTPDPTQLRMCMEKVGLSEITPENILKARTKFADNKEMLDAIDEIEAAWKSELATQPFMYLNGYIDYRRAAEVAQKNGEAFAPWNQVYDPTQKSSNVY